MLKSFRGIFLLDLSFGISLVQQCLYLIHHSHETFSHLIKLDKGGWRKPLTMGNQLTETKEEFSNKAGVRQRYHFQDTAGLNLPQPYNLNDHHKEGPSKVSTTFCGYDYINY